MANGLVIGAIGSPTTALLFQSEYFEVGLDTYYLRARWMDPQDGSFLTMDTYEGEAENPSSLRKYSFVNGDGGVNLNDPTGHFSTFNDRMWAWVKATTGQTIPIFVGNEKSIVGSASCNECQGLLSLVPPDKPVDLDFSKELSLAKAGMIHSSYFANGNVWDFAREYRDSPELDNQNYVQNLHAWGNINFGFVMAALRWPLDDVRKIAGIKRTQGLLSRSTASHAAEGKSWPGGVPPYGNIPAADFDVILGWSIYQYCF